MLHKNLREKKNDQSNIYHIETSNYNKETEQYDSLFGIDIYDFKSETSKRLLKRTVFSTSPL